MDTIVFDATGATLATIAPGDLASVPDPGSGAAVVTAAVQGPRNSDGLDVTATRERSLDVSGMTFTDWTDGQDVLRLFALGGGTVSGSDRDDAIRVTGLAGDGGIEGGQGNDTLDGAGGDDDLRGDRGDDSLRGGSGNDPISDDPGNQSLAGGGGDFLDGGRGDDRLAGDQGSGTLCGDNGNDVLDGGAGGDTMYGSQGDDTFVVDAAADRIGELAGQGYDTVLASVSVDLATLGVPPVLAIEAITLTGPADIGATGNGGANTITGNAGANRVIPGAGAVRGAVLIGGDAARDTVVFGAAAASSGFARDLVAGMDLRGEDAFDIAPTVGLVRQRHGRPARRHHLQRRPRRGRQRPPRRGRRGRGGAVRPLVGHARRARPGLRGRGQQQRQP